MSESAVSQSDYRFENRLIIGCAQTIMTEAAMKSTACLLRCKNLNWDYIFKVAGRNAVAPLVYRNLIRNFAALLPPQISGEITGSVQRHTERNMSLTGTLLALLALFRAAGIQVMPFKGPVLALRYYGDLALRSFGDLDILVQPEDLQKAINLLIENGYEPINGVNWLDKKDWYVSRRKDVLFVGRENKIAVELHWKLSGTHFALPIETNRLWKQAETVDLAGSRIETFSFNHLLIYLCLHGARHGWERFGWICDINELTGSEREINWEQIDADAERLGCRKALYFGLFLVREFFGRSFPLRDWEAIAENQTFLEMAEQIRARLFAEQHNTFEIGERYAYHLKLKERLRDRWKLHLHYNFWYLKIIFSPNEADEHSFHLPPRFTSLYYITRPPRLLYTYLFKSKK